MGEGNGRELTDPQWQMPMKIKEFQEDQRVRKPSHILLVAYM